MSGLVVMVEPIGYKLSVQLNGHLVPTSPVWCTVAISSLLEVSLAKCGAQMMVV